MIDICVFWDEMKYWYGCLKGWRTHIRTRSINSTPRRWRAKPIWRRWSLKRRHRSRAPNTSTSRASRIWCGCARRIWARTTGREWERSPSISSIIPIDRFRDSPVSCRSRRVRTTLSWTPSSYEPICTVSMTYSLIGLSLKWVLILSSSVIIKKLD